MYVPTLLSTRGVMHQSVHNCKGVAQSAPYVAHISTTVFILSHLELSLYTAPHTVLSTCALINIINITKAAAVTGVLETGLMDADSDGGADGSSSSDELLVVKRRFLAGATDPEELQPLEVDEAAARTERRKRKVLAAHN